MCLIGDAVKTLGMRIDFKRVKGSISENRNYFDNHGRYQKNRIWNMLRVYDQHAPNMLQVLFPSQSFLECYFQCNDCVQYNNTCINGLAICFSSNHYLKVDFSIRLLNNWLSAFGSRCFFSSPSSACHPGDITKRHPKTHKIELAINSIGSGYMNRILRKSLPFDSEQYCFFITSSWFLTGQGSHFTHWMQQSKACSNS